MESSWLCALVALVLLMSAAVAAGMRAERRSAQARSSALDLLAAKLSQGVVDPGGARVDGTLGARRVSYEFIARGAGSSVVRWTVVEVALAQAPLSLSLRRQTPAETALAAQDLAVDIELGDPAFDPVFVVEGAPADVIRPLLDAPTRAALLAQMPDEIQTTPGALRLEKVTWVDDPDKAFALIQLTHGIAERVGAAFAAADRAAVEAGAQQGSYRGAAAPLSEVVEARRVEMASLEQVKVDRDAHQRSRARVVLIAALIAVALLAAAIMAHGSHDAPGSSPINTSP
jgi:hypothetical protein